MKYVKGILLIAAFLELVAIFFGVSGDDWWCWAHQSNSVMYVLHMKTFYLFILNLAVVVFLLVNNRKKA